MISMQYMHRQNRALERDAFSSQKFKTRSRPCSKNVGTENTKSAKKRGQKPTFPQMVYQILEDSAKAGTENIVAWEDNGTSFHIYNSRVFNDSILPKYSRKKTKFRSFQRQLNIYGFKMTKKSGEYRHQLFRRGHMHSILRIRPRTTTTKKKTNDRDENDDDTKSISSNVPGMTPSLGSSDDEGVKFQTNSALNCHDVVTTPLLRSISFENVDPGAEKNPAKDNDDLSMWDSSLSCDKYAAGYTPFSSSGISLSGQNQKICATVVRDFDFDLFDDMEGINLCTCNGCGCCFTKYSAEVRV